VRKEVEREEMEEDREIIWKREEIVIGGEGDGKALGRWGWEREEMEGNWRRRTLDKKRQRMREGLGRRVVGRWKVLKGVGEGDGSGAGRWKWGWGEAWEGK
jgi:hypothetical protein